MRDRRGAAGRAISHRFLIAAAALFALAGAPASAVPGEPALAEYAIRWNPAEGGPATAQSAIVLLDMKRPQVSAYRVEYYDVPATTATPAGFSVSLRRRTAASGRGDLTWKLRGDHALRDWACPLKDARQSKAEVDVAFAAREAVDRAYSYSCTSARSLDPQPGIAASVRPCVADVRRWEKAGLKVEEWRFAGERRVIEVSRGGSNDADAVAAFRAQVVAPLINAGIVPSVESKTELGSRCE